MDRRATVPEIRSRLRGAFARRLGIDPRALAALRVSLGLLLVADLLWRALDLVAHYTDAGVLPRALLAEQFPAFARLSLHAVSGAAWFQVALFLIAAAFALALAVGYRTTPATAASFLLLASLHARNPLLLNAGDSLLRRLLFWGLFLPLGGRWSVDALRRGARRRRAAGVATAALLVQVVIVYAVNAVFKLRSDVWLRGDAVRYVFGLDQLTVLLGDALAGHPLLLEALGWLWLAMIVASPLLLVATGRARTLLVSLFVAMHLGMFLTLRLGLFPLVSVAGLLPFLPGPVWDAAETRLAGVRERAAGWGRRLDAALPSAAVDLPPVSRWKRRLLPPVVAVLLAVVLVWNAATLGYVGVPDGASSVADPRAYRWDMFAPQPRGNDGWYVVPGRLESGRRIDAFRRGPVEWDRPPDAAAAFPSHRWLVYLIDLLRPRNAGLRPGFAGYLCRRWNARHADDLVNLTVYYVEQPVRLDGPAPTRRIELVEHGCEY